MKVRKSISITNILTFRAQFLKNNKNPKRSEKAGDYHSSYLRIVFKKKKITTLISDLKITMHPPFDFAHLQPCPSVFNHWKKIGDKCTEGMSKPIDECSISFTVRGKEKKTERTREITWSFAEGEEKSKKKNKYESGGGSVGCKITEGNKRHNGWWEGGCRWKCEHTVQLNFSSAVCLLMSRCEQKQLRAPYLPLMRQQLPLDTEKVRRVNRDRNYMYWETEEWESRE